MAISKACRGPLFLLPVLLGCGAPLEPPKATDQGKGSPAATLETSKAFFLANAESGAVSPPWKLWGIVNQGAGLAPTTSMARPKTGSRSWKFEVKGTAMDRQASKVFQDRPQVSMGGPSGHFMSGYYSFWVYIDAGYTTKAWNLLLGWMTGVHGTPDPISNIGLEIWNGALQVVYVLKNASTNPNRYYNAPKIAGYDMSNGWYRMSASSPAGIIPFPRNRWVHLCVYYKMARQNGRVTIWQNGTKIMDLTAPTFDTFTGWKLDVGHNAAGDMAIQHGIYGGPEGTTRRIYVDDFKVTNYQVLP